MVRMLAARLNEEELPLSEPAYLAMNGWELSKKKEANPVFFFHTNDPVSYTHLKAIRAGETKITITAKFQDGTTDTKTEKLTIVAAPVKGITLDKTKATLKVGDSIKLNPTIDTTGYTGCLWYTSDKNIVSLEEHGNGTCLLYTSSFAYPICGG